MKLKFNIEVYLEEFNKFSHKKATAYLAQSRAVSLSGKKKKVTFVHKYLTVKCIKHKRAYY